MEIKQVPIRKISRYPGNPRKNAAAVSKLADVIREFGWRQPIVVDEAGVIIVGDTRYLAAQQLGQDTVPVHYALGLTPDQVRAYRLADNRVGEEATWDDELLVQELAGLYESGFDLSRTGFEDLELADLLATGTAIAQADPDDTPPLEETVVTQPGDMWILGGHRIICGDSTSRPVIDRLFGKDRPNLMVTDPPYGVEYDPAWRQSLTQAKGMAVGKVANDDRADWRETWALFPGNVAYIWHGGLHTAEVTVSLRAVRFQVRAQIVWVKHRLAISRGNYHWQHEPCLFAVKDGTPPEEWVFQENADNEIATYAVREGGTAEWVGGRRQSTVWFIEHAKSESGHGTQKPVEAMRRPILNNSQKGDCVFEPFSGSGTTLIACESEGRRCLAVELMPNYVDLAVRRWQQYSGEEAVLAGSNGKTFAAVMAERAAPAAAAETPAPKRRTRRKSAASE